MFLFSILQLAEGKFLQIRRYGASFISICIRNLEQSWGLLPEKLFQLLPVILVFSFHLLNFSLVMQFLHITLVLNMIFQVIDLPFSPIHRQKT